MNIEEVQIKLAASNHYLAGDEAAVKDIHRIVEKFNTTGKRPFYIYCSYTGLRKGMSQTPVFEKRLAKYNGDILELFAHYTAREGRPVSDATLKKQAKKNSEKIITVEAEVIPTELLALPAPQEEPAVEVPEVLHAPSQAFTIWTEEGKKKKNKKVARAA